VGVVLLFVHALSQAFAYRSESHTRDAAEFHRTETANYLRLPPVAKVRRIKKTDIWPDAYRYQFWFELPESRAADDWVRSIWANNRFAPNSRVGTAHYGAMHTGTARPDADTRAFRVSSLHRGQRTVVYQAHDKSYYAEVIVPYPGREAGW